MKRRVAVVTDTVSAAFYFPTWHRYYARHVGAQNLYVVLYGTSVHDFTPYEIGGVWRIHTYNNDSCTKMLSHVCNLLLNEYDYVVRVDTDEFLIPDPRHYDGLSDYLSKLRRSYVTAAGYNVVVRPGAERLDLTKNLFKDQRQHCYPYDALSKTCVTGIPIVWSPGFHFASVYPEFDNLYLFHLKYADIDMQLAIGEAVAALSDESRFQEYHRTGRDSIEKNLRSIFAFPLERGWAQFERPNYTTKFLSKIRFVANWGGIYHGGPFSPERVLLEIPDEFASAL
jgi:hypothetical protein